MLTKREDVVPKLDSELQFIDKKSNHTAGNVLVWASAWLCVSAHICHCKTFQKRSLSSEWLLCVNLKKQNTHTIYFLKGHSTGKVALFEVTLGKRQGTTWTHEPRLVRRISTYAISKSSGTAKEKHEHHDTAATPVVTIIILSWYSSASSNQASWDKI